MHVSQILSRPARLPMDEVEVAIYKRSTHCNGMSSSTYSNFDSGICPGPMYTNRHAHSSPEDGDLPASMPRTSFTIPLKGHSNGSLRTTEPSGCNNTINRNGRTPPGMMITSTAKQPEAQSLFRSPNRPRKSNTSRNCVMCILILAILMFVLIVALFIGQWASEGYISQIPHNGVCLITFFPYNNDVLFLTNLL